MSSVDWFTKLRVQTVQTVARWLDVPVRIREGDMHAYKIAEVDAYIAECEKLFGPVFDLAELPGFRKWVHPFLKNPEMIDNPFNLYHHYLETTALYFHIYQMHVPEQDGYDEMNAKMDALWEKYRASGLKLSFWELDEEEKATVLGKKKRETLSD